MMNNYSNSNSNHNLKFLPHKYSHFILAPIIGLNVLIFVLQSMGWDFREMGSLWSYFSANYRHWQWISHLFLHNDFFHIALNMYALCMFAPYVIDVVRGKRFYLMYGLSGLLGALFYWVGNFASVMQMVEPDLLTNLNHSKHLELFGLVGQHVLGASGASYGILAGFALLYPNAPLSLVFIPISFKAKYFVMCLVVYEIFAQITSISLFGNNIAHLAHIGGAIAGGGLMWFWLKKGKI